MITPEQSSARPSHYKTLKPKTVQIVVPSFFMKNGDNKQCSESRVLNWGEKEPVKSINLSRNLLAVSQLELKLHHVINVLKRE